MFQVVEFFSDIALTFLLSCSLFPLSLSHMQKFLQENGFDPHMIRRQGSVLSLSGLSQTSTSSFKVYNYIYTYQYVKYSSMMC